MVIIAVYSWFLQQSLHRHGKEAVFESVCTGSHDDDDDDDDDNDDDDGGKM